MKRRVFVLGRHGNLHLSLSPFKLRVSTSRGAFRFPKQPCCLLHRTATTDFLGNVRSMVDVICRGACEDRIVLDNVSEQIRECLEAAENCAHKASTLPDSSPFKQDFLNLEQRWLELARSIEFGESVDRFTKNNPKPNIKPSPN